MRTLRDTTSLCAICKRTVEAQVVAVDDRVVLRKTCPRCGGSDVLLSSSAEWYERTIACEPTLAPPEARKPVAQGCPYDCGPCAAHEQKSHLPVLPITSRCDLDCPICYTHNKNEDAYHMSEEELAGILAHLGPAAKRIVNITGGEPTLHPKIDKLVEQCREAGIPRVTISTHGLRFLRDEALLERLARLGARVILSFDSFTEHGNKVMLGGHHLAAKLRVLELLEKHRVDTTLLPVLARGINDGEIAAFLELALSRDFIRSVEFHPMTFTGQYGAGFDRAARYTTYDVLVDLERQTEGRLRVDDFVPSPVAHPLCYQIAYLLRLRDGRWLPFTRFMPREDLRRLLAHALYMAPGAEMEEILGDVVNRLWAGAIDCDEPDAVLEVLRDLLDRTFAPGLDEEARLRIAERETKAIYIHTHMDEESFDTDRIRRCCVGMPGPDGTNIPSCAYNVLYRERDPRFMARPAEPLVQLGLGRRG